MKRHALSILVGCAMAFLLAACGGGSSRDCGKICAKIGECGGTEAQQSCQEDCPAMAGLFRSEAWDAAEACILDTPCASLDPESCMFAGVASIPDGVLDGLATTVCTKINQYDSQIDVAQCKTGMIADPEVKMVKIFKDSVLNCVGSCIAGKNCTELQDVDAVGAQCGCGCGVEMWCE